jgi:hypothetical protein
MSDPDQKSNIAIQYDKDFETFEIATAKIAEVTATVRRKQVEGAYPSHQRAAVDGLLRRLDIDDELFLLNVPGSPDGASPETMLTDHRRHGMDGRGLPHEDGRALAAALSTRNRTKTDCLSNWGKLSEREQKTRKRPSVAPSA